MGKTLSKATIFSLWAGILFALDLVAFFLPIGSFLLFIVVLIRPKWFYNAVQELYK